MSDRGSSQQSAITMTGLSLFTSWVKDFPRLNGLILDRGWGSISVKNMPSTSITLFFLYVYFYFLCCFFIYFCLVLSLHLGLMGFCWDSDWDWVDCDWNGGYGLEMMV